MFGHAAWHLFSADLKIKKCMGTKVMECHRVPEKILVYL